MAKIVSNKSGNRVAPLAGAWIEIVFKDMFGTEHESYGRSPRGSVD